MGSKGRRLWLLAPLCAIVLCGIPASASGQAPTIRSESVTGRTTSNAVLHAEIDPHGLLTKYKLQIDTTGNFRFFQYDSCPLHPPEIGCFLWIEEGDPLPEGLVEPPESTLPFNTGVQKVSVDLASIGAVLQPGTTYHFRAIAGNSPDTIFGPDLTFTTPTVPPVEEEPPIEIQEPELPGEDPLPPDEEETDGDPETADDNPFSDALPSHPIPAVENREAPASPSASKSLNRRKHSKRHRQQAPGSKRIAVHPLQAVR